MHDRHNSRMLNGSVQIKGKDIERDLCKIPQNPLNSHQDI